MKCPPQAFCIQIFILDVCAILKLKRLILEDSENAGAWSALGSMLYNGDCAGYTVPSEVGS